jgi:hypothetical protein
MNTFLEGIRGTATIIILGFVIGSSMKFGWNLVENKTKKVCDVCFRDIKRINKLYKESLENK